MQLKHLKKERYKAIMKKIFSIQVLIVVLFLQQVNAQAIQYITKGDKTQLLQKQVIQSSKSNTSSITIEVDAQKTFQTMEGFGFALTGGSAALMDALTAEKKPPY
jgi:O-glycosyl hydrolase